jgi:hypothetical protein
LRAGVARHSSLSRNDTDFEQEEGRNSHVSGDSSVNIAASGSGVTAKGPASIIVTDG